MKNKQESNQNFVGVDLSKRTFKAVRTGGIKLEWYDGKSDAKGMAEFIDWIDISDTIVLEAGNQSFRIAKLLKKKVGCDVIVLNPSDVAVIYRSLKKTDKEDALKLARLAQRNPREELPEVSVPSDEEDQTRTLVSEQEYWSRHCTMHKNRLHSVFTRYGIVNVTKKALKSMKAREKAFRLLPQECSDEATRIMHTISEIEDYLGELNIKIEETLKSHSEYSSLAMSMPGIGPVTTIALLGYVGDFSRFSAPSQVSYYSGLVPKVSQSGDINHHGHIIKRGCGPIRRTIVPAAWALIRSAAANDPLREFYERLSERRGKKRAIVAVARKMMETLYVMFKNGEFYRYMETEKHNKKMQFYGLTN